MQLQEIKLPIIDSLNVVELPDRLADEEQAIAESFGFTNYEVFIETFQHACEEY